MRLNQFFLTSPAPLASCQTAETPTKVSDRQPGVMQVCQANRPGRAPVYKGWSQVPGEIIDWHSHYRRHQLLQHQTSHVGNGMASYGGEIQLFSEANTIQISRPGIHDEEVSLGKNY